MLLFVFARLGILVTEDKVHLKTQLERPHLICNMHISYLVGGTALIGPEHNDVRRRIGELLRLKGLVVLKDLHVCATAFKAIFWLGQTRVYCDKSSSDLL